MAEGKSQFQNICTFNPTKRDNLKVGSVRGAGLAELINTLKAARDAGDKPLTFFLWERQSGQLALTCAVDERPDRPEFQRRGAPGYRPIQGGRPQGRPIQTRPAPVVEEDPDEGTDTYVDARDDGANAVPAPAPARPARGRTMKSVFDGLN